MTLEDSICSVPPATCRYRHRRSQKRGSAGLESGPCSSRWYSNCSRQCPLCSAGGCVGWRVGAWVGGWVDGLCGGSVEACNGGPVPAKTCRGGRYRWSRNAARGPRHCGRGLAPACRAEPRVHGWQWRFLLILGRAIVAVLTFIGGKTVSATLRGVVIGRAPLLGVTRARGCEGVGRILHGAGPSTVLSSANVRMRLRATSRQSPAVSTGATVTGALAPRNS